MMKAPRRSLVRRAEVTRVRAFLLERCLPIQPSSQLSTCQLELHHCASFQDCIQALPKYTSEHVGDSKDCGAFAVRYFPSNVTTSSYSQHTNSSPDLKNTTDDALPNYLHSLKFKQIHTQTDVRLVLGYSAVIIAGALFYFDWKFGWEASKPYTAPAVVAYFLLNGAFSYWLWFVEKGVVYEGEGKTGKVRLLQILSALVVVDRQTTLLQSSWLTH
jgi:hypothetical protein